MGYHKQQLIAGQVELGDRLPAPKPASSHVALQLETRKQRRFRAKLNKEIERQTFILGFCLGFVMGALFVLIAWVSANV